jgi:hypothetical protein
LIAASSGLAPCAGALAGFGEGEEEVVAGEDAGEFAGVGAGDGEDVFVLGGEEDERFGKQ